MQQGVGDPIQSQYEVEGVQSQQPQQIAEEASPISSRPPATGNLDDFMRLSAGADEDELLTDRGATTGTRWPRQETLALLQIRSDMDATFRDATVKGPLWEDVSRKLAELGYKRSAKKCKEKFENVHKYYKRTKEGRGGRQDGKSYRFFSQLEALHSSNINASSTSTSTSTINVVATSQPTATATATLDVSPVSIGIPMPAVPSVRINPPPSTLPILPPVLPQPPSPLAGISFSSTSDGSSSSPSTHKEGDTAAGTSRKRKRHSSQATTHRMMEFFEGLMKHVMQKQEAMQQKFLDAIEEREHDRMVREEAWKRQEIARLSREHELMAQERAISASRDASILTFLQKITGQTIHLPAVIQQPQPLPFPPVLSVQQPPPPPPQQQQASIYPEVAIAVPEEVTPHEIGSFEPSSSTSSRWPKAEVLALIKLRSGLESRYEEAGPKGPLWEEISAGMQRMGYNRSSKRCKEKWENINKYFKKVKESNKKRPQDSKTCPYFQELDALYRKKITSPSLFANPINRQQESTKPDDSSEVSPTIPAQAPPSQPQTKSGGGLPVSLFEEGNGGAGKKPEDIVKEFIKLQGSQKEQEQLMMVHGYEKMQKDDDSDVDHEGVDDDTEEDDLEDQDEDQYEDEDEDEDDVDELQETRMAYKIQFKRQNAGASNGAGNGAPSFFAMVQ